MSFSFIRRIVPESFRWLVTNDKIERAEEIIKMMARINGKPTPDTSEIKVLAKSIATAGKTYTYLDVLKNRDLLKKTILLGVGW